MKNKIQLVFSSSFLHPFLFGLFFVFFLYAHNADEVTFKDTASSFAAVLLGVAAVLVLFRLVYRDWTRAGIATSLFILLFFSYGHVFEIRGANYWTRHRYLLGSYAVIFIGGLVLLRRAKGDLLYARKILNVVAIVLALSPFASLASFTYLATEDENPTLALLPEIVSPRDAQPPDIYYIMLDAYASPESLKEFYNFDNSEFVNFLKDRGFYVVRKPASNHSGTALSLTTILNLDHLEKLTPTGETTLEAIQPQTAVRDNRVGRFLKKQGYTYVQMGSSWKGTFHNPNANVNINIGVLPQFPMMLYRKTIMYPFTYNFRTFDDDKIEWERVTMQFEELKNIPENYKSPVFVFAHIGIPRGPFVFNEDGSFKRPDPEINEPERAEIGLKGTYHLNGYLRQVKYANSQIKEIVTAILRKSKRPPIIIIGSDHGSRISIKKREEGANDVSDLFVRDRMRNFSALYLPDGGSEDLYDTITPVNIFRIIFDRYFGTNLGLVEDRSFVALPRPGNEDEEDDKGEHYNFVDVTDRLQYDK